MSALAQLVQMGVPIAGLGQSTATNSVGSSAGSGTSTETRSTPFNPWSLAPLAFAPFTGGASLAGAGASALGTGLFDMLRGSSAPFFTR
jgi:hypothetical protein